MNSIQKILNEKKTVIFPGVYDVASAKIVEKIGFELMFISGYGVSASHLGLPDLGFLNQSDMCNVAERICGAVKTPAIVDADTGYGNAMNTYHTVERLISSQAKGCFIEDQLWPKRCGHMRGKRIIPRDEYAAKLRAAVSARGDADFFIVTRTDAVATDSVDEALARVKMAKEIGVDGFFIEAPHNLEQMKYIGENAPHPLVANMIEGGKTPVLPLDELTQLGFELIVYPLTSLYAAAHNVYKKLSHLRKQGISDDGELMVFDDFNALLNTEEHIQHAAMFETEDNKSDKK